MDEKMVGEIKTAMSEVVAPLAAEQKAAVESVKTELRAELKSAVETVETRVNEKIAALNAQPEGYRDADGKPFSPRGKGGAPAYVRPSALGDRPLLMTDFARYLMSKDATKFAPMLHVTDELRNLGHQRGTEMMSVLLPLTTHPDYFDNGTQKADNLIKFLQDAMWVDPDVEHTYSVLKSFGLIRKAQESNDDSLGGSLAALPTTGDIIPLLQATAVLGRAGARAVPLPPTGMRWPRETGTPTFAYYNENGEITESTTSTGNLQMTPKKAAALIKIPFELLSMVNAAESFFRQSLVKKAALTEDLAGLEGEGGGQKPLGLLRYGRSANDTPDADKVTLHTATLGNNGDTYAIEDPTRMVANIETANAEASAWVMHPLMFSVLSTRRTDGGGGAGTGPFAFNEMHDMAGTPRRILRGLPVYTSTQINRTSRKGSGTTLSWIGVGQFNQMLLGRVGSIELAASEHAGFVNEQVWIRCVYRHDVGLMQPSAFCICPTLLLS